MRKPRVLVADDEELIRALLVRALRDEYDVVCAADGGEALALLRGPEPFDVVLCDLSMPVMGGAFVYFEMTLRDPDQAQRFVFLYGGATNPGDRALLEGLDRPRLEKPFSIVQLRETVADVAATPP